jgi:hypothetical protein
MLSSILMGGIWNERIPMTHKAQIALQKLQEETERNEVLVEERLENSSSSAAVVSAAKYYTALSSLAKE